MADTTLLADLAEAKRVEDTLQTNKVANFAYTEKAYEDDLADGVTNYDFNRENNIPVGSPFIMNVNETVTAKGFRTDASSIPRSLMNHFLGRLSYNLNKVNDILHGLIKSLTEKLGAPNGYASLDENGEMPSAQLPKNYLYEQGKWWLSTALLGRYWKQSNITTDSFLVVYYANGIWIAGGKFSGIYYSLDGKTWTQSNVTSGDVRAVYYADDIWVAGSLSATYYSLDGKTWTQSDTTDLEGVVSVYYANDIWVAGSIYKGVYYSLDGKTWTKSNLTTSSFSVVYYANGIWVAGSYDAIHDGTDGIYYSLDGKTWTKSNITKYSAKTIYYADGVWVIGSDSANPYYSLDGKTWTACSGSVGGLSSIYYANGIWVAVSIYNEGIFYSLDGKTWMQSNITGTASFNVVHYANGVWITSGVWKKTDGTYISDIFYSLDGKTWMQSNAKHECSAVYYANGVWVAGGSYGTGLGYSSAQDLIDNGWVK